MQARASAVPSGSLLLNFVYLQFLDLLTTIAFLVQGIQEANPFVRVALGLAPNPLAGLAAVKALALVLGVYCSYSRRNRLLLRINILFALVVAWNLVVLIVATVRR